MSSNLGLIYSEFNFNGVNASEKTVFLFENYRLDLSKKMLYRDGEELALPPKAIETLAVLLKRNGEIVSKSALIDAIWTDTIVEDSNLAHYLHILRKTFGSRADGKPYIETLRRRGYRFNAAAEVAEETPEAFGLPPETRDFAPAVPNKAEFFRDAPDSLHPPPETERKINKRPFNGSATRLMAAAFVGALLLGMLVFIYYQKLSVKNAAAQIPFREISVINLTDNSGIYSAAVSRDGKYFSYFEFANGKYHLYLQQTGQPTRLEVIAPSEHLITGSTFSPGGEFIYFVLLKTDSVNGTLYRVPALGGTMTAILEDVASPVSFSPDGTEMVFARFSEDSREYALIIAAADGSREKVLLTRGGAQSLANGGAWSPDGRTIAFGEVDQESEPQTGRYSIVGIDRQSGATRNLSHEKWANCFRMDWTADGEGLVFVGTRAGDGLSIYRDQVYYLSIASGESKRITNDGSRYDSGTLTTTGDNALIGVAVNRPSQIYKVDAGDLSNPGVRLTNGQADGRGGIAPLSDERIGYISRSGEKLGIWTIRTDGSDRKQIFDGFPFLEELRSTPDGKYLVFAAPRDGFSHLYRMDSAGGNLRQITFGKTHEIDSSVSPDGGWIFYISNYFDGETWKKQLRKTSLDAGETIALGDVEGDAPHVSPDGKLVSLVENDELKIYSAQNGGLLKTLETLKPSVLNNGALWSPDGKFLIYPVVDDKEIVNLWQQPIDGAAAPRQMTRFTSGSIYFHAAANDGKTLYLARGEQLRNAVLIKNFK